MSNKKQAPWVKLDVSYFRNVKVASISDAAKVLHLTLITYAAEQRTDGVIPARVCKQKGTRPFKELLDNQLLAKADKTGQVYMVHDYLEHQTPARVISQKAAKGAHTRWHERRGVHDPACMYCQEKDFKAGPWEAKPEGPVPF